MGLTYGYREAFVNLFAKLCVRTTALARTSAMADPPAREEIKGLVALARDVNEQVEKACAEIVAELHAQGLTPHGPDDLDDGEIAQIAFQAVEQAKRDRD